MRIKWSDLSIERRRTIVLKTRVFLWKNHDGTVSVDGEAIAKSQWKDLSVVAKFELRKTNRRSKPTTTGQQAANERTNT